MYVPAIVSLYKTIYEGEVDWYEAGFIVIRMVMIDYDYSAGLDASKLYPIWWMLASLTWIFLGSIVILNILIAVMAESYADIMEKSGPLMARMERARCITRFERGMSMDSLQKQYKRIQETCSPETVKFDPVTDRDTLRGSRRCWRISCRRWSCTLQGALVLLTDMLENMRCMLPDYHVIS